MITINAAPAENSILLDGNNTVISVTSSNGAGHYFRAKIYVDGELFDEQSWSRNDAFTAEKDLKKLYNSYFALSFNPTFTNGLTEQPSFIKPVHIEVYEYLLADDSEVQMAILPDYFIMYNQRPVAFTDQAVVQLLGVEPSVLLLSTSGKIAIPFMVNADADDVNVELKNNFGTVINSVTAASVTGKKAFLYKFNLGAITLVSNTIYFTLTISVGDTVITRNIRLLQFPDFPVKEVAFLNNFGYWQYAYFDGQLTIDNNKELLSYELADESEEVFEVKEQQTYTLNTGALLSNEKAVIDQITNALQVKLFYDGEWLSMVSGVKKINHFKDHNHQYAENLSFSVKRNSSVSNMLTTPEVILPLLEIMSVSVEGSDFTIEFSANFGIVNLGYQVFIDDEWQETLFWTILEGFESPKVLDLSPAPESIRLVSNPAAGDIYSNTFEI